MKPGPSSVSASRGMFVFGSSMPKNEPCEGFGPWVAIRITIGFGNLFEVTVAFLGQNWTS
jgi:hypothetical protein